MRIKYVSVHGLSEVVLPSIKSPQWNRWRNGEEREVPDDLTLSVSPRPGAPARATKLVDALLLAGPEFVDASTGLNPDHVCAECGKATFDQGFQANGTRHAFEDDSKPPRPLCVEDFLVKFPQWIETLAARDGMSTDLIARVRSRVAETKAAQPAAAGAPEGT